MARFMLHTSAAACIGLILANLFWAGNAVIARAVADNIPPFALSFWRWALALVIILPFGLPHILRNRELIRANWPRILLMSVLSVGGYNTLLYLAAHTTSAINISLLHATIPVMIALMGWLLLRQNTTARQLGGIGAALIGIVLIVSQGDWHRLAGLDLHIGDLIMFGAVVIWGIYSVLLRQHNDVLAPIHQLGFLTLTIIGGLPPIAVLYAWEAATVEGFMPTAGTLPTLLSLAVFPGIFAYGLWNYGVAAIGPSRAGIFLYLMPLFAAVLATVFLDERLQGFHAAGGMLILVGVYLAIQTKRRGSAS